MAVRGDVAVAVVACVSAAFTAVPRAEADPRDGVEALPVQGPCCLPDRTCLIMYEPNCRDAGGTWRGPLLTCEDVDCVPPCPADLDGSGAVDPDDLMMFLQCFPDGKCPKGVDGDLNDDGSVDDLDLELFLEALEQGECF